MGIFHLLKRQKEEIASEAVWPVVLGADAKGTAIPMEDIPDAIFSAGVLGTCCGIVPVEGKVYAPIGGKIVQLADTLHAIGIEGANGIEVLIHVGVDTVEMNGEGFAGKVKEGDTVERGQLLLTMDLDKIREAGHPAVVITVITNTDDFSCVELTASRAVEPGMELLRISK